MDQDLEKIASSYVQAAGGNSDKALRLAISDALADLTEAERRTHKAERLISWGYVRGQIGRAKVMEAHAPATEGDQRHVETDRTSA